MGLMSYRYKSQVQMYSIFELIIYVSNVKSYNIDDMHVPEAYTLIEFPIHLYREILQKYFQ